MDSFLSKKIKSIKDFISYLVFEVIVPNIVWVGMTSVVVGILGLKKTMESFVRLFDGDISIKLKIYAVLLTIICVLDCVLGIVLLVVYAKTPRFPKVESDYTVLDSEFELYFKDREHIINRQKITYLVTSKTLDRIPHTMTWTGNTYKGSQLSEESKARGYKLEERKSSASIHRLNVVFPRELSFKEKDEYEIETIVLDENHEMCPFLCRNIKCQTEHLTLKITAPIGMIENCVYYVSADLPGDMPLSDQIKVNKEQVGDVICYKHTFDNVDVLRYYRLSWRFTM